MNFFQYFPTTSYVFQGETNYTLSMVNLQAHVKIAERLRQVVTVFNDYVIQDGDRPDTVADRVYGSVDYTWVILLVNNIFSLFDWPLTQDQFNDYITEKYGSLTTANTTLIYKTVDGYKIDYTSWLELDASLRDLVPTNAYDDEQTVNEAKRRIKVVPQQFVGPMQAELKKILAQ